jgi:DNA-binding SARP family transcriptional activator
MIFRILGPLEVTVGSTPAVRGARRRTLLGTLLLHPNQHLSLAKLCTIVWGEDSPPSTVANLRTYMSETRKLLRGAGAKAQLRSQAGGYRLEVNADELDLLRFQELADDGRRSLRDGDPWAAADQMRQALQLWRGELLADLGMDLPAMLATQATRLEEQRRALWVQWTDAMLELGHSDELVPTLNEICQRWPLHEHAWGNLAIALARAGRTAEALSKVTDITHKMINESGAEPGPELREIHQALLHGATPAPRRLARDRSVGQQVLCPTPQQLPFHTRRLIGRDDVLAEIDDAITSTPVHDSGGHSTLICLSGPPGAGKSAVAIEAARRSGERYPDGRLYVDLRGNSGDPLTAEEALDALLSGFGVDLETLPNGIAARAALYSALVSQRRLVVVLDNAETMAQMVPLIPGGGRNLVLITSRSRLPELNPHRRFDIGSLTPAQSVALLEDMTGAARIADEPRAIGEIVASCAGLPLALQIIGERLVTRPDLSVIAIAAQLLGNDILDQFSIGTLDLRDRIGYSYRRLDAESRGHFHRLVSYVGAPITAAGVAGAWAISETAAGQVLEALAQHSLLMPQMVSAAGPAGFALLQPLQAFAAEMQRTTGTVRAPHREAATRPAGGTSPTRLR